MIESLVQRRPPGVTRGQWGSAVGWTLILHGNSWAKVIDEAAPLAAFEKKFKKKLEGGVDLNTIHWIWDEYALLTPQGANYQKYREQMVYEIAVIGPDQDPWSLHVP